MSLFLTTSLLFQIAIISISAQYNYYQKSGNSLAIWALRPWSLDAYLYGGYFYGYSFAGSVDRPTNWTAGDIENDVYFQMDLTDKKIYMLDEIQGGDFWIKKIDPFCMDSGEWCTEIIYQCNDTNTVCQQQAVTGFNQAVAFDEETRLLWWIGTPDLNSYNYGWYSFNVDSREAPLFHDWGVSNMLRQTANAKIYGGYLWVVEKLHDGLVRYNLTSAHGNRTVVIGLTDYPLPGAQTRNLGAFTFDPTSDLLYFSLHDNYRHTPAIIISRAWDQMTVSPYMTYELGHALPFELRGMAVNPGKELYYITDDGDTTNTISKLVIEGDPQYPPYPRAELLHPSSQYISKSIDIIPGTTLDYYKFYPTDGENTYSIDEAQNWNDGEERLIWMEFDQQYNAAIRQAKSTQFGYYFLDDKMNIWARGGVTAQRFSAIYMDLFRERIWIIDPQEQYMRIQYLDFADNLVHDYYTCAYPIWFTLGECQAVFPVCNADTCSLTVSEDNMMYFTSQGKSYYFNLTHYEQVDPRYTPQQFDWNKSVYYSGTLTVLGNYVYLAASEYGILRKELSTLGIDNSSQLFVDKTDFNDDSIKCFAIDEVRNLIYICASNSIYYDTFDILLATPAGQITSATANQVKIASDSSGIPSSAMIYSLAINTIGTTLWFQFLWGSDIFMLNVPTIFGAKTAGPYRSSLYSLGSSVKPLSFLFYFPPNETQNLTLCEWDNIGCYYKDLTYPENTVDISEWSNIYSKGFQMQVYIHLTAKYINCNNPTITLRYEKIDVDSSGKYIDFMFDDINGTLIKRCGEGTQSDSCNVWTSCLSNYPFPNVTTIYNDETHILYLNKPSQASGNCGSESLGTVRSLNIELTVKCNVEIVEPLPTKAIDCTAANTFCKYVYLETNDTITTQFTTNLFDNDDNNESIFYVYFNVTGAIACADPKLSFEYEGMWYNSISKKIDVYTEDNNYHIPLQTCSQPSTQGCTNSPNNLCIDMVSVNDAKPLMSDDIFIVQVIKDEAVGNQCGSPNRNINADITMHCSLPSSANETTTTESVITTTSETSSTLSTETTSKTPTNQPSGSPTKSPTESPVIPGSPTSSPTSATLNPTAVPSKSPTKQPSVSPSKTPTSSPSKTSTNQPSGSPTKRPTKSPLIPGSPTSSPSGATLNPTMVDIIDCGAENTFCKYVELQTSATESTQFTQNLFDNDDYNESIFYVFFTVIGVNACLLPSFDFEYEGMWYSGAYKKIDVYTQNNDFETPLQTCSNPANQGCTNEPNNLCIDMQTVNNGYSLMTGQRFIIKVVKDSRVNNQCGTPNRNINANITFYCSEPTSVTETTETTKDGLTTTTELVGSPIPSPTGAPNDVGGEAGDASVVAYNINFITTIFVVMCFAL